ncbi:MAG: hypothetical protein QM808_14025 [Steroidobacteraceae bacterium]
MNHTHHTDVGPSMTPGAAYPMRKAGGLFLIFIGLGLVGAIAFSGNALVNYNLFFVGLGVGVLSIFLTRCRSRTRPSKLQIVALSGALLLQALLLIVLRRRLPPGTEESVQWLWVLMIVGVHFLPMSLAFGPLFFLLGLLCIGNAGTGLLASNLPYELFGIADGILKISFGVWALRTGSDVPVNPAAPAQANQAGLR